MRCVDAKYQPYMAESTLNEIGIDQPGPIIAQVSCLLAMNNLL